MDSLGIVNYALAQLNEGAIASLNQKTNSARLANAHLTQAINSTLEVHNWNSAIKRASLSKLSEENELGYKYSYQLPADFLRLVSMRIGESDVTADDNYPNNYYWEIEGDKLNTNLSEGVAIQYIQYPSNISILDEFLAEVIALKLAFIIALNLTGSQSLRQEVYAIYEKTLQRAKHLDARSSNSTGQNISSAILNRNPLSASRRVSRRNKLGYN